MALGGDVIDVINSFYNSIISAVPEKYSQLLNVFIFALLIVLYSIFTWKFYRYLSKKDLIDLNLFQYNRLTHPFARKLFATVLYLIEYVIILPFLIFFWFSIFALLILALSEELTINKIIIVSAAMIAAIRMLAYYSEDLSKDLAKMFPFTLLAIFILSPGFFTFERITSNLAGIPELFINIVHFLVLVIGLELCLRILDLGGNLFKRSEEE